MNQDLPPLPSGIMPQKGSSSVRTTFRLDQTSLEALDWLCDYWETSKKGVITIMKDILEAYSTDARLDVVLAMLQASKGAEGAGERKTYVVERGDLAALDRFAKTHDVTRDELVKGMLIVLKALSEEHDRQRKEKVARAAELMSAWVASCLDYREQLRDLLGRDEAIPGRADVVCLIAEKLLDDVQDEVATGTPVDPDAWS